MVSSKGTFVNKLDTSKKHMKTLGSMSRFCIILANVNESDMQCDENHSDKGCNRPANQELDSAGKDKPSPTKNRRHYHLVVKTYTHNYVIILLILELGKSQLLR